MSNWNKEIDTSLKCTDEKMLDATIDIASNSQPGWSDDDENRLKVITEELERCIMFKQYGIPLSVDDIDWLKSLPERFNPQPKQEWCEEDEEALRELLNILSRRDVDISDDTVWLSFKLKNWLKYLRSHPHWKPSEEQMDELDCAAQGLQYRKEALELLYQNLENYFNL